MKFKFSNVFLISSLIAYFAIAIISAVVIYEFHVFNVSYYISLGALIIPNSIIAIVISKKFKNFGKSDIVVLPGLLLTFIICNVLLFIAGVVCSIFDIIPITIAVIVLIYAVYVILFLHYLVVGGFISSNDEYRNKKVLFKREITDLVSSYALLCKDAELKLLLNNLSNSLRYSDPMSNEALRADEMNILSKANELGNLINTDVNAAKELVQELEILIKIRNTKCARLK